MLDLLGQHQDMAYQRLFEWVKGKCDSLAETGSTEDIDLMLQTAIRYLRKLPIYFSQCQDLVVNSRRTQLVQKFVVALTQGGPAGQVFRAIDLHAHDAVRYVGDMLAWMHQAVASEEEFLESVFGDTTKDKDLPTSKGLTSTATSSSSTEAVGSETIGNDDTVNDSEDATNPTEHDTIDNAQSSSAHTQSSSSNSGLVGLTLPELLARCLQGLGRPLRVRIMQTLESRTGLKTNYKTILFYFKLTCTIA